MPKSGRCGRMPPQYHALSWAWWVTFLFQVLTWTFEPRLHLTPAGNRCRHCWRRFTTATRACAPIGHARGGDSSRLTSEGPIGQCATLQRFKSTNPGLFADQSIHRAGCTGRYPRRPPRIAPLPGESASVEQPPRRSRSLWAMLP